MSPIYNERRVWQSANSPLGSINNQVTLDTQKPGIASLVTEKTWLPGQLGLVVALRNLKQYLSLNCTTNGKGSIVKLVAIRDAVGIQDFWVCEIACTPLRVEVVGVIVEL